MTRSALAGKEIVVTRALHQAHAVVNELSRRGARALLFPTIHLEPATDPAPLDRALADVDAFDWLFLTSQNAVWALEQRLAESRAAWCARLLERDRPRVAVVGRATRAAAERFGLRVAHEAKIQSGEGLALELTHELAGRSVLLPRSDLADTRLPLSLERSGARVTPVVAYCTREGADFRELGGRALLAGTADALVFFSPSSARSLLTQLRADNAFAALARPKVAAIGQVTAAELARAGRAPDVVAETASVSGVLDALDGAFSSPAGEESRV